MLVGGIIDISTKDIPHRASMVIFTAGCNFKCDFCHNKYLLYSGAGKDYSIDYLIELFKNNILVECVSISGGEPTLQEDLLELCKRLSKIGKFVSLDTNGSNPEVVKFLIPYINRVALDIKAPLKSNKFERVIGVRIKSELIIGTYNILNQCMKIEFEIRTTYIENLFTPKDIGEIINFLRKNNFKGTYTLQQYQYSDGVGIECKDKFQTPTHDLLLDILSPYKSLELPFEIYLRDNVVGYCNINNLFN